MCAAGPWGNDATDVSIDIAVPAGNAFCEVSWRQWAIDSRDGETDSVTIDGVEVWSMVISRPDTDCGIMEWNGGPADFPAPWGGASGACFDEITVQVACCAALNLPNHLGLRWAVLLDMACGPNHLTDLVQVPCSPPSVTIRFDSGIDQAESDESYACLLINPDCALDAASCH